MKTQNYAIVCLKASAVTSLPFLIAMLIMVPKMPYMSILEIMAPFLGMTLTLSVVMGAIWCAIENGLREKRKLGFVAYLASGALTGVVAGLVVGSAFGLLGSSAENPFGVVVGGGFGGGFGICLGSVWTSLFWLFRRPDKEAALREPVAL